MAKITKAHSTGSTPRAVAQLKGLNSDLILIDGITDLSVYDHISDSEIHLSKEEKKEGIDIVISKTTPIATNENTFWLETI